MKDIVEHLKGIFKRKKKKADWHIEEPGSDHPVHEEYTKEMPVKK